MMRAILGWLTAVGVLLDAGVGLAATVDPLSNIHSVGVISAMGNEIMIKNQGVTIFTNTSAPLLVDWPLDQKIATLVSSAVGDRFSVVPVAVDTSKIGSTWNLSANARLTAYLDAAKAESPVDAYIVIWPTLESFPFMGKNVVVWGLGFTRFENIFSANVPVLATASYKVLVVDAKTRKTLVQQSASFPSDSWLSPKTIMAYCDDTLRVEKPADVTEDQKAAMIDELSYLSLASLPNTLNSMKLGSASDSAVVPASECTKYGNYFK